MIRTAADATAPSTSDRATKTPAIDPSAIPKPPGIIDAVPAKVPSGKAAVASKSRGIEASSPIPTNTMKNVRHSMAQMSNPARKDSLNACRPARIRLDSPKRPMKSAIGSKKLVFRVAETTQSCTRELTSPSHSNSKSRKAGRTKRRDPTPSTDSPAPARSSIAKPSVTRSTATIGAVSAVSIPYMVRR